MSHFTVLVVTDRFDEVEAALQPYHEYECTGIKDEYVIFVDCHGEIIKAFKQKDNTTKYTDIDEYARNEFGCEKNKAGRYGRLTNPNSKWDWWQIGGRWAGFFEPKKSGVGIKGDSGIMGTERNKNGVDQAQKKDIDFNKMMQKAGKKAAEEYDKMAKIINGRTWTSWKDMLKKHDSVEIAKAKYNTQPVITDIFNSIKDSESISTLFFDPDVYIKSRDEFIYDRKCSSISTFAVVKDGKWYEKGEMGWWGRSFNESDTWEDDFLSILNDVADNQCLTVVDCHV